MKHISRSTINSNSMQTENHKDGSYSIQFLVFSFVILFIFFYFLYVYLNNVVGLSLRNRSLQKTFTQQRSHEKGSKTTFNNAISPSFLNSIPLEKDLNITQSYDLDYDSEKQTTLVFLSTKTSKDNYDFYHAFLKKQGWNIVTTYNGRNIVSMYATKENNDINVTINKNTPNKSWVSISILKKL